LLHPYMMDTQAFTLLSRTTGSPSAIAPRSWAMEKTRLWRVRTSKSSSGNRHRAWGPKTRSTWR